MGLKLVRHDLWATFPYIQIMMYSHLKSVLTMSICYERPKCLFMVWLEVQSHQKYRKRTIAWCSTSVNGMLVLSFLCRYQELLFGVYQHDRSFAIHILTNIAKLINIAKQNINIAAPWTCSSFLRKVFPGQQTLTILHLQSWNLQLKYGLDGHRCMLRRYFGVCLDIRNTKRHVCTLGERHWTQNDVSRQLICAIQAPSAALDTMPGWRENAFQGLRHAPKILPRRLGIDCYQ